MSGDREGNASLRLLISSIAFSVGMFSLAFSFPLLATLYNYSYSLIGSLGAVLAIPFIVISAAYTRLDYKFIRPGTIFSFAGYIVIAILLLFRTAHIFIYLYIAASIVQAFWWITSELSLSLLQGEGNAEKYSAGWGVPNAVVPIAAGIIVQFFSFDVLFIMSAVSFAIGIFFIPKHDFKKPKTSFSSVKFRYMLSLMFAGISMGFIFFVIVPVLKYYSISYSIIGIIVGIFGASSAVGYILLNFIRNRTVKFYAILSSILVFPTFLFGLDHHVVLVSILMVSMGLGTSVSMSKILAYVSSSSSARLGVFYYETVFGVGAIIGSFGGGILFQYYGSSSIIMLFTLPIFYIIAMLIYDRNGAETEVSQA